MLKYADPPDGTDTVVTEMFKKLSEPPRFTNVAI
jgi:hypothetical protein